MNTRSDWMPAPRANQLEMAKNWLAVIQTKTGTWKIPKEQTDALEAALKAAAELLDKAASSERTAVITAQCGAAFDKLVQTMRAIKSHYLLTPPLEDSDYVSLGLKPKSAAHTPVPPPEGQAEAEVTRPGAHLLDLHLRPVAGTPASASRSDYGYRIYYGVLPHGGACPEAALGKKRELAKPPVSGEELPHSKFTRRKKERLDFEQEDSGKTVYFCVRYENSKGDPGAWGPLFQAVIP